MKNLKNELDANRELLRGAAHIGAAVGRAFHVPAPKRDKQDKRSGFSFRNLFKTGAIK